MLSTTPIKLQKPGKGLPFLETIAFRYLKFPKLTKAFDWQKIEKLFATEGERILTLVAPLTPEQFEKPVLIDRIRGIEDSSRFWSVGMTLEHIMIVSRAMEKIMIDLSHNRPCDFKVDLAKAKPKGSASTEEFKTYLNAFISNLNAKMGDKNSTAKHLHPWTGPMTAQQWFLLCSIHHGIHRRQIEAILKLL